MNFKPTLGAVAALLALGIATTAQAVPTLRLTQGATVITCADGDITCDSNPAAGVVTFIGAVGTYNINVTTGLGDSANPLNLMDLNSINNSITGGTLEILFSDIGYTAHGLISSIWGGTISGGTVTGSAFFDTDNLLFAMDSPLASFGPFGGGAFAASTSAAGPATGTYSLTQRIFISSTGPVQYSGDFELKVPEPGMLALLGLGFAGLGLARRRKQ